MYKLASWINTQNYNFNNKVNSMKNENIYNKWKNFQNTIINRVYFSDFKYKKIKSNEY